MVGWVWVLNVIWVVWLRLLVNLVLWMGTALMLTLTGWIKGKLNSKWLVKAHMEPNAQQALVTSFGYVAVTIAILVALTFAGISFTNLAIVGSTEGLVERISIRTTTIRTFDRADVIVPNSNMISSQVTNWTLGNTLGRIKIPIGVGYSGDVETVIATLLEVASNHPDVVKGNPQLSDLYVLFPEFGDSTLNFELRVHTSNINRCMHVISDLNRAINTEFNKKGIEIPFPQRDVHFRNPLQVEGDAKVSPVVPGARELPKS